MCARVLKILVAVSLSTLLPVAAYADDLDAYNRAIEEHPDDAKAYEAFATAAIGQRRYDDAIAKLKLGIARTPNFNRGFYLLAFSYRSKQAWADAADYYRVAIAVKQNENEAYFGLGKALAGLNENKSAAAALRQYVEREKDPGKARFVEAARAEIARLEPPPAALDAGPGATKSQAAALKAEADTLKNQGRLDEAVATYKRALAMDPGNQDINNDLGNAWFGLKRYNDAAQAFKDATARDPNFAIGWYNLANALRKADRRAEAVDAYRHYMALQPNDPDPWFGLGQTLKGLGDTSGAINAFRKYLDMERRPEQQKWVDKAQVELQTLQAMQRSVAPVTSGGKIGFDDK